MNAKASPKYSEANNIAALEAELDWLFLVINQAVRSYLKQEGHEESWRDIPMPDVSQDQSVFGQLCLDWSLNQDERLLLALCLAPHLRPQVLDLFFGVNGMIGRGFTEFGGIVDKTFSGFVPTGQTLRFLLSIEQPKHHIWLSLLSPNHRFIREGVLELHPVEPGIPASAGVIELKGQWLVYLLTGEHATHELSSTFPAHRIETPMSWEDLVLEHHIMQQIEEIKAWLAHGETLMQEWRLAKKIKPGYRALFFGPPGTGKTLTASLLGKTSGRDVYRVDLSMVVSKYIGETEKNLSKVFDTARHRDWILFFDEADALFGQRTEATNSNDRHANQQTGFLLQKIEDFPGVVILATNLKANMDDAFTRRFQAMIRFKIPGPPQRLQLWQQAFQDSCGLSEDVDLSQIAKEHELPGGAIINVLRYCALHAITHNEKQVNQNTILSGIRRELRKENRTTR